MTWRCCATGGAGLRQRLRALDVGLVPACVHLRPRPSARRGRVPVPDRSGGPDTADRWTGRERRPGDGRHRRHHHRGPRLREAGLGLRLLRGPRTQRAPRDRVDQPVGAGGRGSTAPEGIVWFAAGRGPVGRGRVEDRQPTRRRQQRAPTGACRLRVLRIGHRPGRDPRWRRRVSHRPPGPQGQSHDLHHRPGHLDSDRVHRRGLRRTGRSMGLSCRGRRNSVHRVHLEEEGRAGHRAARNPPDPRPQSEQERRAGHVVRHLALPRVLHHHRPRRGRHRGRGQDPPPSRDHRTSPRRPQAPGTAGMRVGAEEFRRSARTIDKVPLLSTTDRVNPECSAPRLRPTPGSPHRVWPARSTRASSPSSH